MMTPTLVDMLRSQAARSGENRAFTFLEDGESVERALSYDALDRRARAVATQLSAVCSPGDRVLLLYPPGPEFIEAFFGCLYAGVVAVPTFPPDPSRLSRTLPRLIAIASDAGAHVVATTAPLLTMSELLFAQAPLLRDLRWLATDDAPNDGSDWKAPRIDRDTIAFLQYTSGSTGTPKGVVLSHANLLHNERLIQRAFEMDERSIVVGWLPQYHDMGLIGNVIQPLYSGGRCVLMSPLAFLQKPLRWLQAISRHRGTVSGGPNFAYDLCARKVTAEERAQLDLSSWQVAFNGAEPIRSETLARFHETFAACGFRRETFYNCYGLAEATLIVTGDAVADAPVVRAIDREALRTRHVAQAGDSALQVGSGRALGDQRLRIVDPESRRVCAEREVGEIWLAGGSVARGYWMREEATPETFAAQLLDGDGPYLRTGDLGYLDEGELFVTGRRKDLIIVRGRNLYPQDLESTVEAIHPALRPGCGAAFSVDVEGEERVVVVHELDRRQRRAGSTLEDEAGANGERVVAAIVAAIAEQHEVQLHGVVLVKPGSIAKTSSGKIQRRATRDDYVEGRLDVVERWDEAHAPVEVALPVTAGSTLGRLQQIVAHVLDQPVAARLILDSLGAVELQHAIATDFERDISLGMLLSTPALESLAALIDAAPPIHRGVAPALATDRALVTPGQEALWLAERLTPDAGLYNIASAMRFTNGVQVEGLRRAFARLVQRHAVLRSVFVQTERGVEQRVLPAAQPFFFVHEGAPNFADEAYRPIDLERGPLLRVHLWTHESAVMLFVIHHLVTDFWSIGQLVEELAQLYRAESGGGEATLTTPRVEYLDWAATQRDANAQAERDWAYFRDELAGELPLLALPTDRPRPRQSRHRGASHVVRIDATHAQRLRAIVDEEGATLFVGLLTAFELLLHRHTGQDEVIIGVPSVGRPKSELADVMGYFVNALPIRLRVQRGMTFREALRRARDKVWTALAHQEIPFPQLVARLGGDRARDRAPIFQTMFVLQQSARAATSDLAAFSLGEAGARLNVAGLEMESLHLAERRAPHDLTVVVAPHGDELMASFQYDSDLFDAATIERLGAHYVTLIEALVTQPAASVGTLPLLSAAEEQQQLVEWNQVGVYEHGLIHDLFALRARESPDAVAVTCEAEQLTYRELDERANQLAHHLRDRGVGPEVLVVISLERSLDLVVAILGVLKAGGAYLPLDPSYPAERVAYMLDDSNAKLVVSQATFEQISVEPRTALPNAAHSDNLAYVIYTSGSTGRPKGVQVTHANVTRLLRATNACYGFVATDVWTLFHSYAFDFSVWELWGALAYGGRLVVVPHWVSRDSAAFLALLAKERVTVLNQTPSAFAQLVRADEDAPAELALRYVIFGGEVLDPRSLATWYARHPATPQLVNMYGITETTVHVTYAPLTKARAASALGSVIGVPIPDLQVYVLDQECQLVPVGVAAELYVGGDGLSRGYLGRPDLTAERFVPHPFVAGARLYRTGDVARRLATGELEYLGRSDDQVKVRGFRIELGEIEAALLERVREAVVVARQDAGNDKRIVAYVAGPVDVESLREALTARLPEYMVPSAFVTLDALPLTANGKVDKKALPAPLLVDEPAYVAPRTAAEEIIAHVWADVLGVPRIGIHDDFFLLGGHSLMATRVASQLRRELGVDVSVRALFEAPTVAGLADVLAKARRDDNATIVAAPRGEQQPLSFAQERLWFVTQLETGSTAYAMTAAVRLSGALDVEALRRSLEEIVARHESLRTTFARVDGRPLARVHAPTRFELPLEEAPAGDPLAHARSEWERPFDLERGPLLRVRLLRRTATEHLLVVAMHHIVSDGWSVGVLLRELRVLYDAFQRGVPSPLPALALQYGDYAAWQRRALDDAALERALGYWKGQLAGAPALLELPTDRPRPAAQSFAGRRVPVAVPRDVTRALAALAQQEGATLFMALLAVWQLLLSRYSGQADIVVGSPIANRTRKEVEELIGFFANMLALRLDLGDRPGFREVLRRVKRATLDAYAQQEVPFERVVEAVNPARSISHSPLFQVTFGLQHGAPGELALAGLQLQQLEPETVSAKFDLVLNLVEQDGALSGAVEYATDLFDDGTVRRMMTSFGVLMESAVATPDAAVIELSLLPAEERRRLDAWSVGPVVSGAPVLASILAVGRTQPNGIAVSSLGASLGFAALIARATAVAAALRAAGAEQESRIGLVLPRTVDMPVAMLACWYAGAAYVPFEPNTPAARMAATCERAGISRILTTRAHAPQVFGVRELYIEELPDANSAPARLFDDSLAYVLYTSGSTGEPKGVAVSHGSLANLVGALHERIYAELEARLARPLRIAVNASYAFDSSVKQWVMLARGHTLCIVPEEARYDSRAMLRFISEERIDVLDITPAQLRTLLDLEGTLPRALLVGGEAIDAALWMRLAALPNVAVFDVYGPTECTVDSTIARVRGSVPTIGTAVGGATVYVLDGAYQRVPVGVLGELCIGGRGVARGYFRSPHPTAERFCPDPFAAQPGARLYRTGDVARHRVDGTIDFVGRVDDQVKVRGFRIELGEVENALAHILGVREAAALVHEEGDSKRIVGYVAGDVTLDALKAALAETLPDYMVPTLLVRLAQLPRTPNGKIDRKALRAASGESMAAAPVAPRGLIEELVAQAWCDVLGLDSVGVFDDFFELGGHSLLAMQVIARVQEGLELELPVSLLFEAPTVAAFAERVSEAERNRTPVLERAERGERPPLSFSQERLWFLEQLEPGSPAYHVPAAVRLHGPLDAEALRRTLEEVVRRHESLRTTFAVHEGKPYQLVHEALRFDLPIESLDGRDPMAVARDMWSQPFDLTKNPQVAAKLLRVSAEEHFLIVTMHHIVSDGWSTAVLLKEIASLYEAFRAGHESPLPPLQLQYVDYAIWQRRWLQGDVLERELAHWKETLAGAPPLLELPLDRPRPALQKSAAGRIAVSISAEQTQALNQLARKEGATLFMTLLAGWQLLLSRYSGQLDVVVGSPIANRMQHGVEGLIGFFANTLMLRTRLDGRPTFTQLLERVKKSTLLAYEHQAVPFERIVEAINPARSMSHTPLFQVFFALQNAPTGDMSLPGLRLEYIDPERGAVKNDLLLNLVERNGRIEGVLEYAVALFDAESVQRMVDSFYTLLRNATRTPDSSIDELSLIDQVERAQLVAGAPDERPHRFALAHAYVEAQAAATPDAIAVMDGTRAWTYAELDERASRIASCLQARGIRAEDRVGLALERNADVVAAMLGVLKAGAVCVPLETSNPASRIAYMLAEADVRLVLAHATMRASLRDVVVVEVEDALRSNTQYVPRGHADGLMYVIYTSGSTGQPKGVALTHHVICNLIDAQHELLPAAQRTAQFASFGFDVAMQEIMGGLGAGGMIFILDEEARLDLDRLGALLTEHRIERAHLPPVMLQQLAERFANEPGTLTALQDVLMGGEQLIVTDAIVRLFERLPGARLHNQYGPAETHLIIAHTLTGPPKTWPRYVPIGQRVPNDIVRVLDRSLSLQPRGAVGELYLGGASLGRGYLGRPDLTADRFVPDPFSSEPGARMYRTGDVARLRNDGLFEYLGRVDHQVKLRGFRIELGEVESALAKVDGVVEATVIVREETGQKQLVGYYVGTADVAALRAALKAVLPDFMVPAAFVQLDVFPLNVNGKVDRRALPAPLLTPATVVEAETNVQRVLCEVWQRVLHLDRVGIDDNYFDLGGDSIRSVQVATQARERGLVLAVRDLFDNQTIRELSAVVREVGTATPIAGNASGLSDVQAEALKERVRARARSKPGRR